MNVTMSEVQLNKFPGNSLNNDRIELLTSYALLIYNSGIVKYKNKNLSHIYNFEENNQHYHFYKS